MTNTSDFERRQLGNSDLFVTPVAMGCWPIAGMTSIDVNESDSRRTLSAAFDSGVNFFDTAYCYGMDGESERLIGDVLHSVRDQIVLASKAGIAWNENGQRIHTGSPSQIVTQCEASLQRLNTDRIDLFYLHAPDPEVDLKESATAFNQLIASGKIRSVGLSNCSLPQLIEFQSVCAVDAIQPHYNMLQREIETELIPHCQRESIAVVVYWPLMKGLLAGQLKRDHVFAPNDGRAKYPMFQGDEWRKNQDFVDVLRDISKQEGHTVSQVVINWTMNRPGVTAALCGAKRDYQIQETAGAMGWQLSEEANRQIDLAIKQRGTPVTRAAV